MKRPDQTVVKETIYIAAWTVILSAIMESVFLIAGLWKPDVLFGNLLSAAAAVLNFFLMGLTVQSALGKEEKDASQLMRFSQSMRMLMMLAFGALGVIFFDPVASILPLFFPRAAITFRPLFGNMNAQTGGSISRTADDDDAVHEGGESISE